MRTLGWGVIVGVVLGLAMPGALALGDEPDVEQNLGRELSVQRRLLEGEQFTLPLPVVLDIGETLFSANWTSQEGAGRPLTKGNGNPLVDPSEPLLFPRNFNRVSASDANSRPSNPKESPLEPSNVARTAPGTPRVWKVFRPPA